MLLPTQCCMCCARNGFQILGVEDMEDAIRAHLATHPAAAEPAWRVAWRPDVGRHLVAARDLAANEAVFSEAPLIVAAAKSEEPAASLRGVMAAVAVQMLCEPRSSPVHLLQEADFSADGDGGLAGSLRTWVLGALHALRSRPPLVRPDGSEVALSEEVVRWAISVASVNVHGRPEPERGVLGLLSSMMEHSCAPTACAEVASAAEGSVITLRTRHAVRAGERLSISYVARDAPAVERRRQLRLQHGFVCACERCAAELAGSGEEGAESWRHAWENRTWCGTVDPYTGESIGYGT